MSYLWRTHISEVAALVVFMNWLTEAVLMQTNAADLVCMRSSDKTHYINFRGAVPVNTYSLIHTKCISVFISIRWHLLVTNMREEQSVPLANLSAVNYGNLPSCLSAFATSLPFVSKSKAGICSIGTFPFLQGHALHKRLMTADIYSTSGLELPLQTRQPNKHTQVPTTSPGRQRQVILKQQLWCLFSAQQWIHMILVCILSEYLWVSVYSMCEAAKTFREQQKANGIWSKQSESNIFYLW